MPFNHIIVMVRHAQHIVHICHDFKKNLQMDLGNVFSHYIFYNIYHLYQTLLSLLFYPAAFLPH